MKKKLVRYIIDDFNLMMAFNCGYRLEFALDGIMISNERTDSSIHCYKIEKGYLKASRIFGSLVDSEFGFYRIKNISMMYLKYDGSGSTIEAIKEGHKGQLLVYQFEEIK